MWGRKKTNKVPTGNKAYQQGYVSFTTDDLKEHSQNDAPNSKAYDFLDQAMSTSSHVKKKNKKNEYVDIDDVYPLTAYEAHEMSGLLDEAEAVADDPSDLYFKEKVAELRSILTWSMKRHWKPQWAIILGVIVSVIFLSTCAGGAEKNAQRAENRVNHVENWVEKDTTISIEKLEMYTDVNYFQDANIYKQYLLFKIKGRYHSSIESKEEYLKRADTASIKKTKEYFLDAAEEREESAENALEEYAETNELEFDDIHEMAIEDAEDTEDLLNSSARTVRFWSTLFLFLIPLYIFAERPYGYTITRTRAEAEFLDIIKKIAFGISGFLVVGAGSIEDVPDTIVTWSDGSKTREGNAFNFVIMAFRLFLLATALIIVCSVSCLLMLYMTIQGLRRNYNWDPIIAKIKSKIDSIKATAQKESN